MSNFLVPHGLCPPVSSVHGILQARILEWVAILTQGWTPDLLHRRQILYCLSHQENTLETPFVIGVQLELGFPGATVVRNLPAKPEDSRDEVQSVGQEDPLEKEMATHSSILAWEIP